MLLNTARRTPAPIRLLLVSAAPCPTGDRLRSAGVDVTAFNCGRAALHHWDETGDQFDAAVIDETAPGLSGQTLTVALRTSGYHGLLIGIADNPHSQSVSRWRERGCDVVVPKNGAGDGGFTWIEALLSRVACAPPHVSAHEAGTPGTDHEDQNGG